MRYSRLRIQLPLQGLVSLLWLGFSSWPGNFQIPWVLPKKKKTYNRKQNTVWRINKAKSWFLIFSNKIDNSLQNLWTKKRAQIMNKKWDIIPDPTLTDIKKMRKYEQILEPPLTTKFSFFQFFRNWSLIHVQCCVSFRCTAKWFSYTYICIHF